MSYRAATSGLRPCATSAASDSPEPPGPPGLTSKTPCCWLFGAVAAAPPAVFPGSVLPAADEAAWPEDEPPAEQAPTPRSAATVIAVAETQPVRPLWRPAARRTATGEIDMSPIMPD